MKINFSQQTVLIDSTELTFTEMAKLEELLQVSVMESIEQNEVMDTSLVLSIAGKLSIDIDMPVEGNGEDNLEASAA